MKPKQLKRSSGLNLLQYIYFSTLGERINESLLPYDFDSIVLFF